MAMDITPGRKPGMGLDMPSDLKSSAESGGEPKKGKALKVVISIIILLIVLCVAGYLVEKFTSISLLGPLSGTTQGEVFDIDMSYDPDSYHALFLSNGQVYFGRVTKANNAFTILQDIYYLQVSEPLQQVPPTNPQAQPQLTLVKLGNELHGPQDYMKINNAQIIFVEELRNDGKVVEAIMQYKAGNQPVVE